MILIYRCSNFESVGNINHILQYVFFSEISVNYTTLNFRVIATTNTSITISWETSSAEDVDHVHLKLKNGTSFQTDFKNGQKEIAGLTPGQKYEIECSVFRQNITSSNQIRLSSYTSKLHVDDTLTAL